MDERAPELNPTLLGDSLLVIVECLNKNDCDRILWRYPGLTQKAITYWTLSPPATLKIRI